MKFDEIYLSPQDLEILKSAFNGKVVNIHPVKGSHLKDLNLISSYLSGSEREFVITPLGRRYLEYSHRRDELILKKSKSDKRYLLYSEIRGWITVALALAAFIKSFFL